jgi:hypothetical protein
MSALLSIPTFVSGPDDKIATVDLYNAGAASINEIRDISDVFKADSLDVLKGGNNLLGSLKSSIIKGFDESKLGIKLDTDSLIKGLISVNPGMISALRSLPSTLQGELTKVNGFSDIAGTFNGIKSQVSKANLSTINGLGSLINGVSGANLPFSFTDKNALAQFSSSLIVQASKVGLKGVLKPFVDNITDKVVLKGIITNVSKYAISNSMTDLLKDVADSSAARILSKSVGGIALSYLGNYTEPFKSTLSQKYENYKDTKTSLNSIVPGWMDYSRAGYISYEGDYMLTGSKDFIQAVIIAAKREMNYVDLIDPVNINTSVNTCDEAYLGLITSDLNTSAKSSIRNDFPLVSFA